VRLFELRDIVDRAARDPCGAIDPEIFNVFGASDRRAARDAASDRAGRVRLLDLPLFRRRTGVLTRAAIFADPGGGRSRSGVR
jgi:hypothetical protein